MNHVMVDLETVDNVPTSAIVSIGAIIFDHTGVSQNIFYEVVDLQSCLDAGLTLSPETLAWWMKQNDAARDVFQKEGEHLALVLDRFAKYLPQDCKLWGNGASFDNAILANAYRAFNIPAPWKFWNDRCYRTVVAGLARRQQTGTYHNALDDAISQTYHLLQVNPGAIK